jgi:hypothetical protein
MVKVYLKQPKEVPALQWMGDNGSEMIEFAAAVISFVNGKATIQTAHGNQTLEVGDWVLKEYFNEYVVMSDHAFKKAYFLPATT